MKPQVGQYHYTPHGRGFRIYRYPEVTDSFQSASPVLSEPIFYDREKAKKRVYELNGWKYNNERTQTSSAR